MQRSGLLDMNCNRYQEEKKIELQVKLVAGGPEDSSVDYFPGPDAAQEPGDLILFHRYVLFFVILPGEENEPGKGSPEIS